jgi:large subunit ribosomal protein L25
MDSLQLKATAREVLGKKVKWVRKSGFTPINVYGNGLESLSLQVQSQPLTKLIKSVGTSRLLTLQVEGEKGPRNVIIKEVQRHMGMGDLLHVSFYQVKMTEKIKVQVRLHLIGESPAVKAKEGELILNLRQLDVECLPADIPDKIDVDLSALLHEGDSINVRDLVLGDKITTSTNLSELVVKVEAIKVEEEEKPIVEAVAEAAPVAEGAAAPEAPAAKKE